VGKVSLKSREVISIGVCELARVVSLTIVGLSDVEGVVD
jgi:hypothetical protein